MLLFSFDNEDGHVNCGILLFKISGTWITNKQKNLQGHPQKRRNKTIAGRASGAGNCNFACDWARSPICGGLRTGSWGGGGVVHDWNALGTPHCTFANGLAKPASPPSAVPFFEPPVLLLPPNKLSVFGSEMFPNPAFRSASLVPKELSIFFNLFIFSRLDVVCFR